VCGTTWLDGAITVNRAPWPVLTMDWIDGRTLNEYVDYLVTGSNAAALTTLAAKWRELVARLQSSEFVHGDLQHGNVMVDQAGRIRLVDFDGVWIPQLAGHSPPTEFGHANYQHPARHAWDRWLDTFSALVIYLSLVALSRDPGLWLALYNSKNLLFAKGDFFPPFKTDAWKQLAALGDPQVDELVRRLQECCDPDWVSNKSLEMTLDQQAVTPARAPIPVEQRWWEKQPSGAVGPAAGAASASRPWAQGPPQAAPMAAATAAARAETSRIATGPLPAPPPLSAPLSVAGTGPMPQLSQTMAPPGATTWWSVPGSAGAQGSRPGSAGYAPTPPVPQGYAPRGPVPPMPGPPVPGPPAPAPRPRVQSSPLAGGIALGLGIVLLIIGAATGGPVIVIGGLVAGAWGIWRLVTGTSKSTKPPQ